MAFNVAFKKISDLTKATSQYTFYLYESQDKATVDLYLGNMKLSNQDELDSAIATLEAAIGNAATKAALKELADEVASMKGTGEGGEGDLTLGGLNIRLTAAEAAIETEKNRAIGVEGTLDTAIKAVETTVAGHTDSINTLNTNVGNLQTAISGENGVNKKIEALASADDAINAQLEFKATTAALNSAKSELEGKINNKADKSAVDTLGTTVAGKVDQADFDELDLLVQKIISDDKEDTFTSIKELVSWVEEHEGDAAGMVAAIEANTEALKNKVETSNYTTDKNAIDAAILALQGKDTSIEGNIESINGQISTLQGEDTKLANAITTAQTAAEAHADSAAAGALKDAKDYTDTKIGEVNGVITTLSGKVDAKAEQSAVDSLSGTVSGHATKLGTLETTVSGHTTRLGEIGNAVSTLQTNMSNYYTKSEVYKKEEVTTLLNNYYTSSQMDTQLGDINKRLTWVEE